MTTEAHRSSVLVGLLALLVAGCDPFVPNTDGAVAPDPGLTLQAPAALLTARAVDVTQLRPTVILVDAAGNTIDVTVQQRSGSNWSGSVRLDPDTTYRLEVTWHEAVAGRDLLLAKYYRDITTDGDGVQLTLATTDYDLSPDFDSDGMSNLQEREAGTDPFVYGVGDTTTPGTGSDTGGTTDGSTSGTTDGGATGGTTDGTTDGSTSGGSTDGATDSTGGDTGATTGSDSGGDSGNDTGTGTGGDTTGETPLLVIPRIAADAAPLLDGPVGAEFTAEDRLPGEWGPAAQVDANGALLGINHLMIDNGAEAADGTPYRRWAAMHDGEYLYLLVLVDDLGRRTSDSLDYRDDDSVELFIDADRSRLSQWGDADDWHLILPLLPQGDSSSNDNDGRYAAGAGSALPLPAFSFVTGPGVGPDGIRQSRWEQDVYEIRVSLASAGLQPGDLLGLELQVNDDDDGGARDSKWGWAHPSRTSTDVDGTWLDPSLMAPVRLAP